MNKEKNKKNIVFGILIILTLSIVLFKETLKNPSLIGVLGSIAYLITHLAIIFYTTENYKKRENKYFQGVIYAYAAVLGIQILQSGNYILDYGLSQNVAIAINCFNLISFANVIKFSDNLDSKLIALSYMIIAIALKLGVEIFLIVKMFAFIQLIHIFMSLSIPILGITIIVAYIYRLKRCLKDIK